MYSKSQIAFTKSIVKLALDNIGVTFTTLPGTDIPNLRQIVEEHNCEYRPSSDNYIEDRDFQYKYLFLIDWNLVNQTYSFKIIR